MRADETAGIVALVGPDEPTGEAARAWLANGPRKLIVFGGLPKALAGYAVKQAERLGDGVARAEPAPPHQTRESPAVVHYGALAEMLGGRRWRRPFRRFDFGDEWNNVGYGAITADGSMWSVAPLIDLPAEAELASVTVADRRAGSYAGLIDGDRQSILWFARPVGPIDSFEWFLVERFLSSHRAGKLPSQPVLSEIPHGYDSLITMRLDCDEDVESARDLWQAYRDWSAPLSLAIHTSVLGPAPRTAFIAEVAASGGSILSHSATHARNWGGSTDAALIEATASADRLEQATGVRPAYAVSPFHQTPAYALESLAAAGYGGCIGGNIASDPAFNLARGGSLAELPVGFVGHSQQCMLHGDCLLGGDDPIATYREAFDLALETRSIFGYLDHPFSARYQYGWRDAASRIAIHRALIDHVEARAARPLFLNEDGTMDFLIRRSAVEFEEGPQGFVARLPEAAGLAVGAEYRGRLFEVRDGMILE